jgi:hypothetical protein
MLSGAWGGNVHESNGREEVFPIFSSSRFMQISKIAVGAVIKEEGGNPITAD